MYTKTLSIRLDRSTVIEGVRKISPVKKPTGIPNISLCVIISYCKYLKQCKTSNNLTILLNLLGKILVVYFGRVWGSLMQIKLTMLCRYDSTSRNDNVM